MPVIPDSIMFSRYTKVPASILADEYGLTRRQVVCRAYQLGISRKKAWTDGDDAALRAEYERPVPLVLAAIAEKLGRSKAAVSLRASKLGITGTNNLKLPPKQKVSRRKYRTLDEARRAVSSATRARFAKGHHPKGMLGKKHSQETLARISEASAAHWSGLSEEQRDEQVMRSMRARRANGGSVAPQVKRGRWKAGWRQIGSKSVYCRSRWEANYGRYLEWLKLAGQIADWEHEPKTFWFEGIKRGCVSYLPDFRVDNCNGSHEWHEVKGWMDARSATVLKRMAKYHPDEKIVLIREKQYREICRKVGALIHGWEK